MSEAGTIFIPASEQIERHNLGRNAMDFDSHGEFAVSTDRARESDWKVFAEWVTGLGCSVLPVDIESVVQFVRDQSRVKKLSTIRRYVHTIIFVHRQHGLKVNWIDEIRLELRKTARRIGSRQRQVDAFTYEIVGEYLDKGSGSICDVRDVALLSVAYDTLCRRSELVALTVDDLVRVEDGTGRVLIRRSKTDQFGEGMSRFISRSTMKLLDAWLEYSKVKDGCIFRSLRRNGVVLDRCLSDHAVASVIKRIACSLGLDPKKFSGHSTRVGAAQDMVAANINLPAVAHAGGWRSVEMPRRYSEKIAVNQSGMAQLAEKQRR